MLRRVSPRGKKKLTHGYGRLRGQCPAHPLYVVWAGMKARCHNPRHRSFKYYGGRGIKVCKRWQTFKNFLEDMGHGYGPGRTLERKNRSMGYEPGNVVWATWETQRSNRSDNRIWELDGLRLTVAQWAKRAGLRYNTLFYRVHRSGWTVRKAITTP